MQRNNDEKQPSSGKSKPSGSLDALTQERATKSNAIEIPQISLPKGGGALKGIDEKFQVNPSNGTSSFSIPLPLSPNRNGFTPALSISYNSGAGNSVLGIGWGLDFPSIQRKTDKKLPRYRDFSAQPEEEDVFMFSGVEDLVPKLKKDGQAWVPAETIQNDYRVQEYRPRIEGAFSRIERIQHSKHGIYWRVTSRDNVTTIFGRSKECRIADPEDESRIFQWLPEMSFDDKGSVVKFVYKVEDLVGVANNLHEKNRGNGKAPFVNRYLKRVLYGNKKPFYPHDHPGVSPYDPPLPRAELFQPPLPEAEPIWHFELVFDYGDHDKKTPAPDDKELGWGVRPDAFSSYRAGFEIRTWRLLKRVLMFHRFPELNENISTLVRSLDFKHQVSDNAWSDLETELEFLTSITQTGYIRRDNGTYASKSLPPMEFTYQPLSWNHEVREVQQKDLVHAPVGLSANYQWVDLYNEGINGILTEQGNGWFYKHNLGDTDGDGQVAFEPAHLVAPKPSFTGLSGGLLQLQDLEANGRKQVVVNTPGIQGYFELNEGACPGERGNWEPFRAFLRWVNIDLRDPNVRVFDINGDGQPEIVLSEERAFCWWPSEGKEGYGAPERAGKPFDDEQGPAIVFSDPEQRIFLADMSGDGLTDIVRIRNGEVCYWPNLGYGRFGAKVSMDDAPSFDRPDQFNPAYLQLADISGTGATDLIYLGKNQFRAWLNLSGNGWGEAEKIAPFFPVEQPNRLTVTDLLGTGTACIVWSSELPAYSGAPMRYMDLMGGEKPHIMTGYRNNFGKEVAMQYRSSTHFYLKDKLEGHTWITRLPFPVQVVERVELRDRVTGVLFVNQYSYHHGYYDHAEREFRGFGRVDQLDTEDYDAWKINGAANALPPEHHEPPVLTRTWYHTGAFLSKEKILSQFETEYWYQAWNALHPEEPVTEHALPDALIDTGVLGGDFTLPVEELREALRACKGMILRQEVFALDGSDKEALPYTVATHNCNIRLVQPRGGNRHASFVALESEATSWSYERNPADPRVGHTFNVKVDDLGNVLLAVSVVYPRKVACQSVLPDFNLKQEDIGGKDAAAMQARHQKFLDGVQHQFHITLTENDFTHDVLAPGAYRLRLPAAVRSYELKGLDLPNDVYFSLADIRNAIQHAVATPYEDSDAPAVGILEKRLIEHVTTRYRRNDLQGVLLPGELESLALPFESYQLAFTPALLQYLYGNKLPAANWADVLGTKGRFEHMDNENWWISSGKPLYAADARDHFYLPAGYEDPFESVTTVAYDPHYLSITYAKDAEGNEIVVERFSYRTLAPERLRDPNGNGSETVSDELGLPVASAVFSKPDNAGNREGDTLENGDWNFTTTRSAAFFQNPTGEALNLLQTASTCMAYDFTSIPVKVATVARETHYRASDAAGNLQIHPNPAIQTSLEYSDGLGQVALKKIQAEPGEAWHVAKDAQGNCQALKVVTDPRWLGNGRTILNNKGKTVRQYEPYFSDTHAYEDEACVRETGVTPVLYYDAVGRLIRTELPDGTETRVEFDAWEQSDWDANDTVLESRWYKDRQNGQLGQEELRSAQKTMIHNETPERIYLDSLGRPVYSLAHNKWAVKTNNQTVAFEQYYPTLVVLDIEGNVQEVRDARDNPVMTYRYDMLGHRLCQTSMDAGERWMLPDAKGDPLYEWDFNERITGGGAVVAEHRIFFTEYDKLHRPLTRTLRINDGDPMTIERLEYGETHPEALERNLRGQLYRDEDQSGQMTHTRYNFKGNLLEAERALLDDYKQEVVNWTINPILMPAFTNRKAYDALNRPISEENWHLPGRQTAVYTPVYNQRGLLKTESILVRGQLQQAITGIEYNEKGQRTCIKYGNGTTTRYAYDPKTFRLRQLRTTRPNADPNFPAYRSGLLDPNVLQQLHYTYDPTGNITEIYDEAYEPVFFKNQQVEPRSTYTYDALYRLICATGRENYGKQGAPGQHEDAPEQAALPVTDKALRNYAQYYRYDGVGNIQQMRHVANGGSWTRDYSYAPNSNRLTETRTGNQPADYIQYHYDPHGSMLNLANVAPAQYLRWDYRDMIQGLDLGGGGRAWYQYDSEKQRSRKVIATAAGAKQWERLYLGGMELYRRYGPGGAVLEEIETHHLMADEQRFLLVEDVLQTDNNALPVGVLWRYQYGNHLGSVALEVDERARIISYEEYHPYGTSAFSMINSAVKACKKRYRYTGMERDEESGLSYHGARYYVGWLGRWGSCDPVGLINKVEDEKCLLLKEQVYINHSVSNFQNCSSIGEEEISNIYQYALCNPINKTDLRGTKVDQPKSSKSKFEIWWLEGYVDLKDRKAVQKHMRTAFSNAFERVARRHPELKEYYEIKYEERTDENRFIPRWMDPQTAGIVLIGHTFTGEEEGYPGLYHHSLDDPGKHKKPTKWPHLNPNELQDIGGTNENLIALSLLACYSKTHEKQWLKLMNPKNSNLYFYGLERTGTGLDWLNRQQGPFDRAENFFETLVREGPHKKVKAQKSVH